MADHPHAPHRTPDDDGPWNPEPCGHLGDAAFALVNCYGKHVAVGLTERDAAFICRLMEGSR